MISFSSSVFIIIVFFVSLSLSTAELTVPENYPLDRYDSLRKHLPFGKPTVIESEAPKPPPFTVDMTLIGFSKVGSGYYVTVMNKKNQEKIIISPRDRPDGITVAEVLNNPDLAKVEIKLKKGDEIGSINFDPNFLATPKPGAMPVAQGGQNFPQPPGGPNNGLVLPRVDANGVSVPNAPGTNPENPANAAANPNQPAGATTPPTIKRVRRVIVPTRTE